MTVRFVWRGQEFKEQMLPVLDAALTEAASAGSDGAAREIKSRPAVVGRPVGEGGGRVSVAGESPTTQLGILRQSIAHTESTGLRASIGSGLKYARWLELGTSRMSPRPWLKKGVLRSRKQMRKIFVRQATRGFDKINLTRGGA